MPDEKEITTPALGKIDRVDEKALTLIIRDATVIVNATLIGDTSGISTTHVIIKAIIPYFIPLIYKINVL